MLSIEWKSADNMLYLWLNSLLCSSGMGNALKINKERGGDTPTHNQLNFRLTSAQR